MSTQAQHIPVLMREAVDALNIQGRGVFVDATFGRGGHTAEILKLLGSDGVLFALDRDPTAIALAEQRFADDVRVKVVHTPFDQMRRVVGKDASVNGILMDLGVSSPQLDEAERGFSFMRDGELDMRMDSSMGETAAQWLARVEEADLVKVLFELGEEKFARRISRAIIETRNETELNSTLQLAHIIAAATPKKDKHKHPATRAFQAIRLYINQELIQLNLALPEAVRLLAPGGRLVVISFHSLEDRIVKRFMRAYSQPKLPPKYVPTTDLDYSTPLTLIGKAAKPSQEEISGNPRSRSSVIRIAERTDMDAERMVAWEGKDAH
ncbi:MAG: 16S rRNA (cytosine(1402)-N(4))-methyltransferase RsmH [Arenicella sp.]|jgi:16S rRNA (cytosine1402-N4)-methyltransferase|nr:16S rRNA (cytosine(1402)-N(4))-methyltransferase RsmH [Arenicella sp.]